jgi:hypothetical protein
MVRTIITTDKPRVSGSIQTFTSGTSLGCVHWIDQCDIDSKPVCFVCDELLQLVETPIMQPSIKFPAFSLFPDTFQIFHHECISNFECGYNLFAYFMVFNSHKPSLFTRDSFEQSSGTTSAFGLKFLSQSSISVLDLLDSGRIIKLPVRSDDSFVYAEVQAKNTSLRLSAIDLNLFSKSKKEETPAFFINPEQTFLDFPILKIFFETISNLDIKGLSAFDSCYFEDIILERGTSWEVVSDRTSVDNWFRFCFLDNACCLFDTGNSKLAMQSNLSEMFIDERMKFDIVPDFVMPSSIYTELQSLFVKGDSFNYLRGCFDSDLCCCTKSHNLYEAQLIYKSYEVESQFIPRINSWVSLRQIL